VKKLLKAGERITVRIRRSKSRAYTGEKIAFVPWVRG
jgi:hypothetical protein